MEGYNFRYGTKKVSLESHRDKDLIGYVLIGMCSFSLHDFMLVPSKAVYYMKVEALPG